MQFITAHIAYDELDYLTWNQLFKQQEIIVQDKACQAFLDGLNFIKPWLQTLPDLNSLSNQLEVEIGWSLVSANGFLGIEEFFGPMLERKFPINVSLRKVNALGFDPMPDLFHDCFGHLPLLCNREYSSFLEKISEKILSANEMEQKLLAKIYWYTIEAGVCYEHEKLKVYGTSQLSSFDEITYTLSGKPQIHPFNFQKILQREPYPYAFQEEVFSIPCLEFLAEILDQVNCFLKQSSPGLKLVAA